MWFHGHIVSLPGWAARPSPPGVAHASAAGPHPPGRAGTGPTGGGSQVPPASAVASAANVLAARPDGPATIVAHKGAEAKAIAAKRVLDKSQ